VTHNTSERGEKCTNKNNGNLRRKYLGVNERQDKNSSEKKKAGLFNWIYPNYDK